MLIRCPECELQVSDKALSCPHCGFPFSTANSKTIGRKKSNRRRRLPNGFGQISEIKNRNLRKPFRAMVSVGKDGNGRPICKLLKPESYFPTYNDAYLALVEYNRNPYDLESGFTVRELYEKWLPEYEKTVKNTQSMKSAWPYCSGVYNMRVKDLRARHIKGCMENGVSVYGGKQHSPTATVKQKIKSLFNLMLDYALEYELVDKNYARTFNLSDETIKEITTIKHDHIPFTDEEVDVLWANVDTKFFVDVILIQCYSGWRPQEMGLIKLADVDLDSWTFRGGMKTPAGIGRVVPIHSRIKELVRRKYKEAEKLGSQYLLNYYNLSVRTKSAMLTYDRYRKRFEHVRDELGLNPAHRPHDGRKHFVTMAKKYNLDEYAIKYIVGHNISDITEKVYTQRELDWLRSEMEKIR